MPTATLLPALADSFEHLLADHDTPSLAIGVAPGDDTIDLVVQALPHHPVDHLLGFSAPPEWAAFGIVARGRTVAWPDSSPATSPLAPPPGTPVQVAHLVARSGASLTRMVDDHGHRHVLGDDTMGLVPDLCLRILGLPTPAPVESPLRYWAARWLGDVLDITDLAPTGPDWSAVAACHPAVVAIAGIESDLAAVASDHLVLAAESLARAQPWSTLHRAWGDPEGAGHAGLTPAEVAWMDPGMLARWCLGLVPEVDDLVEAAAALLPPSVNREIAHALEAWDLLPGQDAASRGEAYDHAL